MDIFQPKKFLFSFKTFVKNLLFGFQRWNQIEIPDLGWLISLNSTHFGDVNVTCNIMINRSIRCLLIWFCICCKSLNWNDLFPLELNFSHEGNFYSFFFRVRQLLHFILKFALLCCSHYPVGLSFVNLSRWVRLVTMLMPERWNI